jgi:hypothetical protein
MDCIRIAVWLEKSESLLANCYCVLDLGLGSVFVIIALVRGHLLLKIGTTVFMVRRKSLVYSQLDEDIRVFWPVILGKCFFPLGI